MEKPTHCEWHHSIGWVLYCIRRKVSWASQSLLPDCRNSRTSYLKLLLPPSHHNVLLYTWTVSQNKSCTKLLSLSRFRQDILSQHRKRNWNMHFTQQNVILNFLNLRAFSGKLWLCNIGLLQQEEAPPQPPFLNCFSTLAFDTFLTNRWTILPGAWHDIAFFV